MCIEGDVGVVQLNHREARWQRRIDVVRGQSHLGVIYLGTFYHGHECSRQAMLLSAQHVEHEGHP